MAAERMTPAQALRAEPAAAEHSEARDRFAHVVGAAGRVAAAAGKERRERDLVDANQSRARFAADSCGPTLSELSLRSGLSESKGATGARELRLDAVDTAHRASRGAARRRRRPRRRVCGDETARERAAWRGFARRRRPFFGWLQYRDAPAPASRSLVNMVMRRPERLKPVL